jgi:hypothetical protein
MFKMILAKLVLLLGLSCFGGYLFTQEASRQYEKGLQLTEAAYQQEFQQYKSALLNRQRYDNLPFSVFVMLMVFAFWIGSYELLAILIGFLIGKVIRV